MDAQTRVAATALRARLGSGAGGRGSRLAMSGQRSGDAIRSAPRNRVLRSGIVVSQKLAKALPPSMQVHSHRRWRGSDDVGYLLERVPGVMVENNRGALLRGEPWESHEQLRRLVRDVVAGVRQRSTFLPSSLQFACRDPEGRRGASSDAGAPGRAVPVRELFAPRGDERGRREGSRTARPARGRGDHRARASGGLRAADPGAGALAFGGSPHRDRRRWRDLRARRYSALPLHRRHRRSRHRRIGRRC